MSINKGKIGNALESVAPDHVVAVANDIFDETLNKYQSELNQQIGQGGYNPPQGGIPKSDLSSSVQASLDKADAAVPNTRTVNGKALSTDITLNASDVSALPSSTTIPTSLSQLTSDTAHRTVTDSEKTNWSDKYTKTEVNNMISSAPESDVIVVDVPSGSNIATYLLNNVPAAQRPNNIFRVPGTTSYSEWAWNGTAFIQLDEKNYGVDDEPKDGSLNLITSDAVAQSRKTLHPSNSSVDLSFQDEDGNAIMELDKGHIKTKNFDSKEFAEKINRPDVGVKKAQSTFAVSDESGNNIIECDAGHIKTKEFDSRDMLAINGLVSNVDRLQDWVLSGGAYTTQYTYEFFDGGFQVKKNVSSAPGHNRVIDFSNDILPCKVTFEYSYDGTNNIPVFDSKNAELTVWGVDVSDKNIIGTIKPGTGTLGVEVVHADRKYIGIYCNDMQNGATLRVSNTHADVKVSTSQADQTYMSVYSSKVNEVSDAYYNLGEGGRIGYIFITDMHFNGRTENNKALLRQIQAVVDIANNCQVDFVCVGGDTVDGTTASTSKDFVISYIRQMMKILSGCKCPVAILTGNHDDNSYHSSGYGDTNKGFYSRNMLVDNSVIQQMMMGGSENDDCYYYFDIEKKNLRVICLDYIDYNKNAGKSGRNWWGFSREQVTWFCSVALNTNKNIIILSHGQIVDVRYGFWNLEDEGDKNWNADVSNKINSSVPAPSGYLHAYYPGYTTDLKNAVIAFNNKSSITLYGNTYDFSTKAGSIILSHHGHFHSDFELSIGNMPVILTGCAKNEPGDTYYASYKVAGKTDTYMFPDAAAAEAEHANGYGYEFYAPNDRTFGTLKECLFDVVSINSTAVNIIRVGAGNNRVINR